MPGDGWLQTCNQLYALLLHRLILSVVIIIYTVIKLSLFNIHFMNTDIFSIL